jgi:colicin import membrane protein
MASAPHSPRYTGPIVASVVLHLAVIAALVLNVPWPDSDDEQVVMADVIDAEVVEPGVLDEIEARREREAQQQAEQRRLEEQAAERERREAAEQQAEQQAEREAEQEAKRQAEQQAERERREEALRIAEENKRREEEEQQRLAEEKRRREEEQRRKEEQRRREERLAEERRLSEQAQNAEWERLQQAEEEAEAQARSRELATKMQLYKQAIKQRVDRNWIRPVSAQDGYTCEVVVDQIPGGEIVNVRFNTCDGDSVFQRSVRNAVYKSSPLPDPPDPALFERRLNFTFRVPDE